MAGIQKVTDSYQSDGVVNVPPIGSTFDATTNDSNKTFTVPGNELWKLNFAQVVLTTDATVGDRVVTLVISDSAGNTLATIIAGAVQAASATVTYTFWGGLIRETSVVNGELQSPIPADIYLQGGATLRFYDSAAIAAAADDMTVSFQYQKFTV